MEQNEFRSGRGFPVLRRSQSRMDFSPDRSVEPAKGDPLLINHKAEWMSLRIGESPYLEDNREA